jgi:hypothetical protein
MHSQHAQPLSRRRFLGGVTLAGMAGLLGAPPRPVAAEPLSTAINVELVGGREVFRQHGTGVAHRDELLQCGIQFAH